MKIGPMSTKLCDLFSQLYNKAYESEFKHVELKGEYKVHRNPYGCDILISVKTRFRWKTILKITGADSYPRLALIHRDYIARIDAYVDALEAALPTMVSADSAY